MTDKFAFGKVEVVQTARPAPNLFALADHHRSFHPERFSTLDDCAACGLPLTEPPYQVFIGGDGYEAGVTQSDALDAYCLDKDCAKQFHTATLETVDV